LAVSALALMNNNLIAVSIFVGYCADTFSVAFDSSWGVGDQAVSLLAHFTLGWWTVFMWHRPHDSVRSEADQRVCFEKLEQSAHASRCMSC